MKDMMTSLEEVVSILKRALVFLLIKEDYRLVTEKVSVGLKSYKHRHDIVFSQAVR